MRYIGKPNFRPIEYLFGIELDSKHRGTGKNNGSKNGAVYFECEPKCGVFVKR